MSTLKVPSKKAMPKPLRTSTPISSSITVNPVVIQCRPQQKQDRGALEKDVKECLKLLAAGDVHLINVTEMTKNYLSKPELGDHLQYELHNYCKKDPRVIDKSFILKLSNALYSSTSVAQFNNMDRFVGCVYYLSAYFLKVEEYEAALHLFQSLSFKKDLIKSSSVKSSYIQNFLYNLHSIFISSAITLTSKLDGVSDKNWEISHKMALASVGFVHYFSATQTEAIKKVLKTTKLYLHTVQHFLQEDIFEFYNDLVGFLKPIVTNFSEWDYICHFLCKVDFMKNVDTSQPFQIHAKLKKVVDKVLFMANSPLEVTNSFHKILKILFLTNTSKEEFNETIFNNIHKVDSRVYNHLVRQENVGKFFGIVDSTSSHFDIKPVNKVYFLLMSILFHYATTFWWKTYERDWCNVMSFSFMKGILQKILFLCRLHCQSTNICCSLANSPFETCFSELITGNLHKILYTVRICFKSKMDRALELSEFSLEAFKVTVECVDAMANKQCCHSLRNFAWKHSVIHLTNTVEDILRIAGNENSWKLLRSCSRELIKAIVNSEFELPYEFRRVNVLFQRWHHANLRIEDYGDNLFLVFLYYACYPQEESEIMSIIIQTKKESNSPFLQGKSLVCDELESCKATLKEFYKGFPNWQYYRRDLALLEIKTYGSCPLDTFENSETAYNLVWKLWKTLPVASLDIWQKAVALSFVIITGIRANDKKLCNSTEENCNTTINSLLLLPQHKNKLRSQMHAGNLTFFLFLYHLKAARNSDGIIQSNQVILGYLKKKEEEKIKFGEELDVNLSCNVIPTCNKLNVQLEKNYLSALDEIVKIWNKALEGDMSEIPTRFEYDWWLQSVKQVALLFELYGDNCKALTTWFLFYRIGKLCNDSAAVLLGLSHLLESVADVEKSKFFNEAETTALKFDSENKEKNILVEYWISVASNYLKNKKPQGCLEYLMRAQKAMENLKASMKYYILGSKFWCLVSQFLCLFPEHETKFGFFKKTDFRVMVFKAFSYANRGTKNEYLNLATQGECAEVVLVLLEVNLWAYYFFGIYSKTDFMRFFLNDIYQIVQKLILPTRIAEILVRLAEVDMICEKTSECQEKVITLKSILTTLTSKSDQQTVSKSIKLYTREPAAVVNRISPRVVSPVRFLDTLDSQDAGLSPIHLHLDDVKPSRKHDDKCKCDLCQDVLIQILTMNVLALEGNMYQMEKSYQRGDDCFNKACDIVSKLEQIQLEQAKTLRNKLSHLYNADPGVIDIYLRAIQFQNARFNIKRGFYEASKSPAPMVELKRILEVVSKLMRNFTYEEILLKWTFTELKLAVFMLNQQPDDAPKKKKEVQFLTPARVVAKTPHVLKTKENLTTVQRMPRVIPESDSVEEDKENISKGDSVIDLNTAFIGGKNLPKDEKPYIMQKKLDFNSSDLKTVQTVKKAPKNVNITMKPKKLNLDETYNISDSTEIVTRQKVRATSTLSKPTSSSTKPSSSTATKVAMDKPMKKSVASSVKVHVDESKKRASKLEPSTVSSIGSRKKTTSTLKSTSSSVSSSTTTRISRANK